MPQLLRIIRLQWLLTGSFRKYSLYAVGEIILVVIGILIALQINSWNQERTNIQLEMVFLERLGKDLEADLETFQAEVEFGRAGLEHVEQATQLLDQTNTENDLYTFNAHYDLAIMDALSPHDSTSRELESTGQINLIRNDSLRMAILDHYAFYRQMEKAIDNNYLWRKNISTPFDSETTILKFTDFARGAFPSQFRHKEDWDFFNNPSHPSFQKTEVALAATAWYINSNLQHYSVIFPRIEHILELIRETLSTDEIRN